MAQLNRGCLGSVAAHGHEANVQRQGLKSQHEGQGEVCIATIHKSIVTHDKQTGLWLFAE